MPDIFGDIIRRIDALEAAVRGHASEFFDRKLFKPDVALREGRHMRSIERGYKGRDKDKTKERFPRPDGVTNGREWWWLSTLESMTASAHNRQRGGSRMPERASPRSASSTRAD